MGLFSLFYIYFLTSGREEELLVIKFKLFFFYAYEPRISYDHFKISHCCCRSIESMLLRYLDINIQLLCISERAS